jgi:hypothetical protein
MGTCISLIPLALSMSKGFNSNIKFTIISSYTKTNPNYYENDSLINSIESLASNIATKFELKNLQVHVLNYLIIECQLFPGHISCPINQKGT